VATGDFVFVGDLGRPDLLETAAGVTGQADSSARRLYKTVREFAAWPDYMQVWPGHGAGSACGKALGAVPQSTVGYEKMFNPSVKAAEGGGEAEFVAYMLGDQPEPPVYFARMKRLNKEGARVLGGVPKPPQLDVAAVKGLDGRRCAIVDTRVWAAFKAGHLAGALYIPLTGSFSTEAGSMIGEDEKVYLVVEPGRVDEAVRGLIRVGIDNVAGWIDAGQMGQLAAAGLPLETSDDVTVAEVQANMGEGAPFFLDARRQAEFVEGHIPGATNIAHTRLLAHMAGVPKDRPVVVNCQGGGRSARACSLLQKHGYTVANLAGGFSAWAKAGGPVQK
jgi:hydroxyacylglutathione hydrolase